MRALLIFAATIVLLVLVPPLAFSQAPADPQAICSTWRTQWNDVSVGSDPRPMRAFVERVPATCRNLRSQIERFISQRFVAPVTRPETRREPMPAPRNPCDEAEHAWAELGGSSDVALLQQFVTNTPASCSANGRAQMRIRELQQPVRASWRDGQEFSDCGGATWCPRMVVIPAGSFMMGATEREYGQQDDELPRHRVTVRQFGAGKFEVTFREWDACVADGGCDNGAPLAAGGDNRWGRGARPVIEVSWDDAQAYVLWLSRETGRDYRLLSEAEWEYAARSGAPTPYSTGSSIAAWEANFNNMHRGTEPVGSHQANSFGLYDMHGNVWEWVQDCYAQSYYGLPADGSAHELATCSTRVNRGGDWRINPQGIRSANRNADASSVRTNALGFRVARTLD